MNSDLRYCYLIVTNPIHNTACKWTGLSVVIAMGPGNPPAVRVRGPKTVRFGSRTVLKPDPLSLGGPNLDPYPSNRGFFPGLPRLVGSNPRFCVSSLLFMVSLGYLTANRKIFTFVGQYSFQMNLLPLVLKWRETRSVPHPEHHSQWCVNDFWSCIMGNLGGNWMQTIINEILDVFQTKRDSDLLPARFWKWASTEHQRFLGL